MEHLNVDRRRVDCSGYLGFTLTEVLIAVGILGLLAIFAIPKILQTQNDSRYKAIAKETAMMVQGAYATYQQTVTPDANTFFWHLTPYMRYVKVETTGTMDRRYGQTGIWTCDSDVPCLLLHNGAKLRYYGAIGTGMGNRFGGTSPNHYIYFVVDPDGKVVGDNATNANGVLKSVDFLLYYGGAVRLINDCVAGDYTYDDATLRDWCPAGGAYPDWFSWD